jgi:ATP-dependent DNA helicase PIF1
MTQTTALKILKTGASVFLTGEPGSGKSYTVRQFTSWLQSYGIDPVVTASTGIAATHIGGMTIHSWSGMGIKSFISDYDLEYLAQQEYLVKRMMKATTVIIDEISMIDKRTLDNVDRIMRHIRRNDAPFGGVQMIFVGDFFQLPPITRRGEGGDEEYESQFACFASSWQDLSPVVCYLTEQHRQEDDDFVSVLSGLRSGQLEMKHKKHLKSRFVTADQVPALATQLYAHNARVDDMNLQKLNKVPGEVRIYSMSGKGSKNMIESLQRNCLSPAELAVKPGAIVMFTKNLPQLGVMNGTLGTVLEYSRTSGFPVVKTLSGALVIADPVEWAVEVDGKVKGLITQVPLRLAWAITIHKSQGMSLDAAVIDLSNAFEYGQGYVALSRVRTLAGVYLLGLNQRALEVHPEIASVDGDFRAQSEDADELYSSISEDNLQMMHEKYITVSGGELDQQKAAQKKLKIDTYSQTEELAKSGKTCAEIAEFRSLTVGTVLDHIEKLALNNRLDTHAMETLFPDASERVLQPVVAKQFDELGVERLAPVFTALHGRFSYDDLKRMRMLYVVAKK